MDENGDLNFKINQDQKTIEKAQNTQNFGEIKIDNFEESLNISDIGEDQGTIPKKEENQIITEDFSEDLDNIKEDEFTHRKISDYSIQSDEFKNEEINIEINTNKIKNKRIEEDISKKYTRKITKEELDNIPLPLFSCIYCSNMIIAFKHLSQEIVINKYLFQTSIYDIKDINKLIIYQPLIDKDKKNEKLLDIIIKSTEYIYYNYTNENIKNFFKSKNYMDICNNELNNNKKYLTQKIEETIVKKKKDFYFKDIKNIPKNSINNRCLFNSTNSLINNYNALSGLVETFPVNNNLNNNYNTNKINNTNNSNFSINFNSISLNNNEIGNICKDNNNFLVSIVEHIENNNEEQNELEDKEEFKDLLDLDEEKKFSKDNIIWDNYYYDIWNPSFSDIDNDKDIEEEDYDQIYFKCDVNDGVINNNKINQGNLLLNKKRKFIKYSYKKSKFNSNYNTNNDDIEDKKNYKLKVNLLKSQKSNNSVNFKLKPKSSVSQIKSFGSTNNSTMINFDNKNITNFSSIKDTNNSSQNLIYVNTIKENEIITNNNSLVMNNKDIPSKSQNFFHRLKQSQKAYPNFINMYNSCTFHPNINKSNKKVRTFNINKNFFHTNYLNFKIKNEYDISNIINKNKYNKNKCKIFKEKKIKERNKINIMDIKRIKNKNSFNFSKTVFNINSGANKTTSDFKNIIPKTFSHIFKGSKVISSKILFNQSYNRNKITNTKHNSNSNSNMNTNIIQNKIKNSTIKNNTHKKANLSQLAFAAKEREKITMDKIRQKIAELNRYIKNKRIANYNTNLNNRMKLNKIKDGGLYTTANTKNLNYISENKNNFDAKKKLCLSNSFLIRPKSKITDKNNKKKLFFKN